jgi:hypothetical protein
MNVLVWLLREVTMSTPNTEHRTPNTDVGQSTGWLEQYMDVASAGQLAAPPSAWRIVTPGRGKGGVTGPLPYPGLDLEFGYRLRMKSDDLIGADRPTPLAEESHLHQGAGVDFAVHDTFKRRC